jgi:hypothetical protein
MVIWRIAKRAVKGPPQQSQVLVPVSVPGFSEADGSSAWRSGLGAREQPPHSVVRV